MTINAHAGYNVYATNGVHYVTAKENDTFENIGRKFRISPRNLRKFNDLKDKQAQPIRRARRSTSSARRSAGRAPRHHIAPGARTAYLSASPTPSARGRSKSLNKLKPGEELEQGRQIRIK